MDHIHTFFTTQGHGGPPRMSDQPDAGATSETRRIWNDDYGDQMIFGDLVGLKFPDICLTGEEKPRKTSPGNLSRPGIEPGPAA